MWIFYFQIIAVILTSSYAADLYCFSFTNNQCEFGNITNVAAPNEAINVVGQAAGFVDTTTQDLSIDSTSQFFYFPTKILQIYPNLTSLTLNNNSMTTLVTNAIDYCQSLTYLTINNELFTILPAEFAQNCMNLKNLDLGYNQIATIDNHALKGLSKLTYFNVESNKITCIPPGLFANKPIIERIDFSNNSITAIDPITFRGLPWLLVLWLIYNNIQYLPNLNMTDSGLYKTNPNDPLAITFIGNPIIAIDPQFIPTLYGSRLNYSTYTVLDNSSQNTCIPKSLVIFDQQYSQINDTLSTCYNNWNPSFVQPVVCLPSTTTSTTTTAPKTTTAKKRISCSRSRMSSHKMHRHF